jgi:hypothetical protein
LSALRRHVLANSLQNFKSRLVAWLRLLEPLSSFNATSLSHFDAAE